jgi:hypothetical protein
MAPICRNWKSLLRMPKILPWNGRTHFKNGILRTANSLKVSKNLAPEVL